MSCTFYSAVNTVKNALAKAKDEKGMARVAKFLCESVCPACHGTPRHALLVLGLGQGVLHGVHGAVEGEVQLGGVVLVLAAPARPFPTASASAWP